jgi:UDP-N-acetylmuramate dehydrogenase
VQIDEFVPLAPFTTLKVGGPARFFARVTDLSEIRAGLRFAQSCGLPVFVLGGGSNLVVPDVGFPGMVLAMTTPASIVRTEAAACVFFDVSASTAWDEFVLEVCRQGISGVECLAGIPGQTGATPVQNVGAYGQEVAQSIEHVTALDLLDFEAAPVVIPAAKCGFGYRRSRFNAGEQGRWLVLSVRFRLSREALPNLSYADLKPLTGANPTPLDVYHFVREVRFGKGMLIDPSRPCPDMRSAGSFFKNPLVPAATLARMAATLHLDPKSIPHWPVRGHAGEGEEIKLPAAWLIERAGFPRGFTLDAAGISSRHTLALINRTGDASCADLLRLRDRIADEVQIRFGITLEQEPLLLEPANTIAQTAPEH